MSAEEWLKLALQSPVFAALVVGVFGIVTIKLGLSRFRSERWWEKKAASYAAVIEGLHAMYDSSKAYAHSSLKGYELSDEFSAKLEEANLNGWAEIRKGASIGSFVMTKRAASILGDVIREMDAQSEELPTHEFHNTRRELLSDAIFSMKAEAKRDLGT